MANPKLAGVIGFFDHPDSLIAAMKKLRDAHYQSFDAFTPFPVHGLDEAQGLKRSFLPFVTLGAGLTGASLGFILQYWTSAVDWPINVAGKPFNSWPAFVPIMFELTILFGGLSTVAAMFFTNRLPNLFKRSFDPRITRDRFALFIESPLSKKGSDKFKPFEEYETTDFLKQIGAKEVRSVYSEGWF